MSNFLHTAVPFIASAFASPVGQFLFDSGKNYISNKKKNAVKIVCLVIPSGSGKSQLVAKYSEEFGLTSPCVLLDLEDAVMKSPLVSSEGKKELDTLKYTSPIQYQLHLFPVAKEIMASTLQHMIDIKSDKTLVVLVSSIELKRVLLLQNAFYFAPAKKLFETITASNPSIKHSLEYSRSVLDKSDKIISVFSSFEALYEMTLEAIGVTRTLN